MKSDDKFKAWENQLLFYLYITTVLVVVLYHDSDLHITCRFKNNLFFNKGEVQVS